MISDPLINTALLGTSRMTGMPPAPDSSLESTWNAISLENLPAALLQGLALRRALLFAGHKACDTPTPSAPSDEESSGYMSDASLIYLQRLLEGEFPEILSEWLHHACASGNILPPRLLPDFLTAATRNSELRNASPALVGQRGYWLARRWKGFSWLLSTADVADNAWDTGIPQERQAWFRSMREQDPERARSSLITSWASEDNAMREALMAIIANTAQDGDIEWLESTAIKDRRQQIRALAIIALGNIPTSPYLQRAVNHMRPFVSIQGTPHRRSLCIKPPTAFVPAWAGDGIKEKPPQGIGEKSWWLRQLVAAIPIASWPAMLSCTLAEIFNSDGEEDWRSDIIAGWVTSSLRWPELSHAGELAPLLMTIKSWPSSTPLIVDLLREWFAKLPPTISHNILATATTHLPAYQTLLLLSNLRNTPPTYPHPAYSVLEKALETSFKQLDPPLARSLAVCVPRDRIQQHLVSLSNLENLTLAAEQYAHTLEFRLNLIASYLLP